MLLNNKVLVAPGGALRVNFCTVRLVAAVEASTVTVLVRSLVIRMNELISGGLCPLQLSPSLHKPLAEFVQIFSPCALGVRTTKSRATIPGRIGSFELKCFICRKCVGRSFFRSQSFK